MTAPAPSPAEQAVIDRFGIFEPEARVVEEVARAIEDACGDDATWLTLAAAAVAAYRAAQDGGAEDAVRRVEALADWLDTTDLQRDSGAMIAGEIRDAIAGPWSPPW